jgi:DNA-directed RNA polymerase delta subunit
MATPILSTVTGTTTGNASERIGQNATIAGTNLNDVGTELLIRDPDEPAVEEVIGGDFSPAVSGATINRDWAGVCIVGDNIYMTVYIGRIYTVLFGGGGEYSELSGQTVSRNWRGIVAVGDLLYAVVSDNGRIYYRDRNVSGDFIELAGQTVNRSWYGITAVDDILYATVVGGRIYYRDRNVSGNFIELSGQTVNRNWAGIVAVGDILYATVIMGRIYYRDRNVSGNFIELSGQTVNRSWFGITAVGDILYAAVSGGRIYYRDRNVSGDFIELSGQTVGRDWRNLFSFNGAIYGAAFATTGALKSQTQVVFPYQNITDQIQSSTSTEIIFQTPEFELGTYKLAVENNDGISNELDFEILESTPIPTLISVIGSTTGNNTERANLNATITGTDFLVGALLNLLIKPVDAIDWIDISDRIVSATDTTIVFTTPDITLGNYLLAVQNEIGISNELDFTILAKAQALFRKLRNMFNQIGKSVSGDLISCAVSDLINPNGCSEFFGNLLKNGSFCETTDHWGVATTGEASSSSGSIVDREFHLVVNNGGSVDTDITISQHNILFRERTTYTLDIMAKTSAQTQTIRIQVTCGSEIVERLITLGQTHTAFKIPPFTFFSSTFGSVRIFCGGAGNTGTIQIAYINLQELR